MQGNLYRRSAGGDQEAESLLTPPALVGQSSVGRSVIEIRLWLKINHFLTKPKVGSYKKGAGRTELKAEQNGNFLHL